MVEQLRSLCRRGIGLITGAYIGLLVRSVSGELPAPKWVELPTRLYSENGVIDAPRTRSWPGALDPVHKRFVLFAAHETQSGNQTPAMVWTMNLDTLTWTPHFPAIGAAPQFVHAPVTLTYHPLTKRMILYGDTGRGSTELWALDMISLTWRQLHPVGAAPPNRHSQTAVYDARRDRILIHGGVWIPPIQPRDDVWELSFGPNGPDGAWRQLTTSGSAPPARWASVAIVDTLGDRMIIYGGLEDTSLGPRTFTNGLWSLDLATSHWTDLYPQISGTQPPGRHSARGAYDPAGKRMLVYGGSTGDKQFPGDAWSLDLEAYIWKPLPTDPGPRQQYAADFDHTRGLWVVHGGMTVYGAAPANDTWLLDTGKPVPLPLGLGLTHWWPAEGTTRDSVTGCWAESHGNLSYTGGVAGQAFALDGVDDYVAFPGIWYGDIPTLEMWVKTARRGRQAIIDGGPTFLTWRIEIDENGRACYRHFINRNGPSSYAVVTGTTPIDDGQYHYVVAETDQAARKIELYVDGNLEGSYTAPAEGFACWAFAAPGDPKLGWCNTAGLPSAPPFLGAVDELRTYGRPLTPQEVQWTYKASGTGPPVGRPPVASAGADFTLPATTSQGALVETDGSGSYDPDGDQIRYNWSTMSPAAWLDSLSAHARVQLPVGRHQLLLAVRDRVFTRVDSVTVTVTDFAGPPANHPPVTAFDWVTAPEDTPLTVAVLANDRDPDGDVLHVASITQPMHGVASIMADSVRYMPAMNYNGIDSLFCTITDGHGGTAISVLGFSLTPVNDRPVAVVDLVTVLEDSFRVIPVCANDQDVDHDRLRVLHFSQPREGVATLVADSLLRYAPRLNYFGQDTLRYVVGDGKGGEDSTLVVITVLPVNDPPDCAAVQPSVRELWPPNNQMVAVRLFGATDVEGDPVTITVEHITQDEPVEAVSDGRFAPDGGGVGSGVAQLRAERAGSKKVPGNGRVYVVHYAATDGQGGRTMASVRVTVPHDQGKGPAVDDGQKYDSVTGASVSLSKPAGEGNLALSATNFPNPFNPSTTIAYVVPEGGLVRLTVYNVAGQEVRTLVDEVQSAGRYVVTWSSRDQQSHAAAPGIYLYRLEVNGQSLVRRMALLP